MNHTLLSTAQQPLTLVSHAPPSRWGCYNYFSFTTAWSITEQLQSHPLGKCFLGQTELCLSALQVGRIPWPLPCSCGWVSPVRCLPGTWVYLLIPGLLAATLILYPSSRSSLMLWLITLPPLHLLPICHLVESHLWPFNS